MKIFITGATGMLGNDLIRTLSMDHEIITTRVDITILDKVIDIIRKN